MCNHQEASQSDNTSETAAMLETQSTVDNAAADNVAATPAAMTTDATASPSAATVAANATATTAATPSPADGCAVARQAAAAMRPAAATATATTAVASAADASKLLKLKKPFYIIDFVVTKTDEDGSEANVTQMLEVRDDAVKVWPVQGQHTADFPFLKSAPVGLAGTIVTDHELVVDSDAQASQTEECGTGPSSTSAHSDATGPSSENNPSSHSDESAALENEASTLLIVRKPVVPAAQRSAAHSTPKTAHSAQHSTAQAQASSSSHAASQQQSVTQATPSRGGNHAKAAAVAAAGASQRALKRVGDQWRRLPAAGQAAVVAGVAVAAFASVRTIVFATTRRGAYVAALTRKHAALQRMLQTHSARRHAAVLCGIMNAAQRMHALGVDSAKLANAVIPSVLQSLSSNNARVCINAAAVLRTLAYHNAANADAIVAAGGIDALTAVIQNGRNKGFTERSMVVRQHWRSQHPLARLSRVIGWLPLRLPQATLSIVQRTITFVPRIKDMVFGGGEDSVWEVQPDADESNVALKKEAAMCALLNLTSSRDACVAIDKAGALRGMVELLWVGTDIARTAAAETIYNILSQVPKLRNHFYSYGADIALEQLYSGGNNVMRAAAVRGLMAMDPGRDPTAADRGELSMYD